MQKVKILLTLILLSLIIMASGCGDIVVKTPPWSADDLKQAEIEKQEVVPILRIEY